MSYIDIEDAILAALEPLKTEIEVRTIKSYGGDFSPQDIESVSLIFPAILVHVTGLENETKARIDIREIAISVYVAHRNARGEEASRKGDTAGSADIPGVYGLLDAVREKLHRKSIADVGALTLLTLQREKNIGYSKRVGMCVSVAEYKITVKKSE